MKAYTVKVTGPNNPKLGQGENPAPYFPPSTHVMKMLRYKNPKKKLDGLRHSRKISRPSLTVVP
jgi:hypothetical protein